jgi:cholesterol oxidase
MTPTATTAGGVVLRETMRERRDGATTSGRLHVTLEIPDLVAFRADDDHRFVVTGTLTVDEVAGELAVTGEMRFFPARADDLMRYDLVCRDEHGRLWHAVGVKRQEGRGPLARYRGLTTVRLSLVPADGDGPGVRTVLALGPSDVLRNGTTIRGTGATRASRLRAYAGFATDFSRAVLSRSR